FTHLKTVVRPQESFVFVVGQMEVIYNDLYIYARNINLININHLKRKIFNNRFNCSSKSVNITRSNKLLPIYQNINKNSKNTHKIEDTLSVLNDSIDEFNSSSFLTDNISSKCARVESCDKSVDEFDNNDKCDI
ncbi:810_t:CDS:1, partial [Gigaspora rosea]